MRKQCFHYLMMLLIILTLLSIKNAYAYENNPGRFGSGIRRDYSPYLIPNYVIEKVRQKLQVFHQSTPPVKPVTIEIFKIGTFEIQRLRPGESNAEATSQSTANKTVPVIGVIYGNPTRGNLSGYWAIRINDKIYEIRELSTNRAVYRQRDYQDLINKTKGEIEIGLKFLTNNQINQLQTNLEQDVGKEFTVSYEYADRVVDKIKSEFDRVGVEFYWMLELIVHVLKAKKPQ